MDRVKFLAHNGRRILHIDLSNIDLFSELRSTIAQAKIIIGAEPENSIYTLTDVTDIAFTPESTNAVKGLAMHNKPYVIAGAVVGVTGLRKVVFNSVLVFTGRTNLYLHESLQDAKDWLAKY